MEREALKSLVDAALGSTKLTGVTDETFNHQLDFALGFVSDDSQVDDAFVGRIVENLKNIDGGVHKKVGEETRSLRERQRVDPAPKTESEGEPEWFRNYRESQEERIKKIEDERSLEKAEAERRSVMERMKADLKAKISASGREVKDFFIDVTLRDAPKDITDFDKTVAELEERYNANLKSAGVSTDAPFGGGEGGEGGGTSWLDKKFAAKAEKEGWSRNN